eukprot:scaffold254743_cov21-Prasinocladus_malaysianus.AAC.1
MKWEILERRESEPYKSLVDVSPGGRVLEVRGHPGLGNSGPPAAEHFGEVHELVKARDPLGKGPHSDLPILQQPLQRQQ